MRDAIRIQLSPSEYQDHQRAERERLAVEVAAFFEHARDTDAEWYRWIANGCPPLSREEYARVGKFAKTRTGDTDNQRVEEQLKVGA